MATQTGIVHLGQRTALISVEASKTSDSLLTV